MSAPAADALGAIVQWAVARLRGRVGFVSVAAARERIVAWSGPEPPPLRAWPADRGVWRRPEPGVVTLTERLVERPAGLPAGIVAEVGATASIGLPMEPSDPGRSARLWVLDVADAALGPAERRSLELLARLAADTLTLDRHAVEAKRGAAELLRVLETITDAHARVDTRWRILDLGPGFEVLAGRSRSLLTGRNLWDEFPANEGSEFATELRQAARRRSPTSFEAFAPLFGRWVEAFVLPHDERVDLYFRDIDERKRAELELVATAYQDAMTGLANRAQFMDWLRRALGRAERRPSFVFAVLFLDVDRLKVLNDSLGHMFGDEVLRTIARRLEDAIRPGDNVARLGGDEFGVLLYNLRGISDATRIAGRIQRKLREPIRIEGQEVETTASVGIALSSTGYDRADDILHHADLALYRAKGQGRERFEVFDDAMRANATAILNTRRELRAAVEGGQLELRYIPVVSLYSGAVEGLDATLQWHHPQRGRLEAAAFLPVIANSSLLLEIGRWSVTEACRMIATQRGSGPPPGPLGIGIRISARHFLAPDFGEEIGDLVRAGDIEAAHLRLSLPVDALSANPETAAATLAALDDVGVSLSVHGFGDGPLPAAQIGLSPFQEARIDLAALEPAERLQKGRLIQALVAMARHLGMDVVAEGVDSVDRLPAIRDMGCTYVLGTPFSRALDVHAALDLLSEAPRYPVRPDDRPD